MSLFQDQNSIILLLAPPAWGKTSKLLEVIKSSNHSWVFVSPLRALANEFYLRTVKQFNTQLIRTQKDINIIVKNKIQFDLLIITPELFQRNHADYFEFLDVKYVLDEFHLYHYWGETFREKMVELYKEIFSRTNSILALTATMNQANMDKFKDSAELNFDHVYIADYGNQKLMNPPAQSYYYPKLLKFWIIDQLMEKIPKSNEVNLIFVATRDEVDMWVYKLMSKGIRTLGCKGGETSEFANNLELVNPQVIVSTTCLSHGVNLPKISRLYITYQLKNLDFWIQMVGRGGRKGERFEAYTMDNWCDSKKQIITNLLKITQKHIVRAIKNKIGM